jgi:hypothetical protein
MYDANSAGDGKFRNRWREEQMMPALGDLSNSSSGTWMLAKLESSPGALRRTPFGETINYVLDEELAREVVIIQERCTASASWWSR